MQTAAMMANVGQTNDVVGENDEDYLLVMQELGLGVHRRWPDCHPSATQRSSTSRGRGTSFPIAVMPSHLGQQCPYHSRNLAHHSEGTHNSSVTSAAGMTARRRGSRRPADRGEARAAAGQGETGGGRRWCGCVADGCCLLERSANR